MLFHISHTIAPQPGDGGPFFQGTVSKREFNPGD
jgi:hypothetical protein